ncbi:hypothetical protein [Moraxella sp. ZY210820]|uniref:hypothetical protein n=1 Tax=unclassified Moraxella TaxID=2685852 RepID=UPI0027316ACF|nr:hypothetical protein [Moraxella sp. ZY210820]WLF84391.1 hypothetical protein LU301_02575 [Moraxella sp. ZY210820]
MWQWFKRQEIDRQLGFIIIFGGAIYIIYMWYIVPIRWHLAETKKDCGVFVNYYDRARSGKGSTWTERWLIIQGQTGKTYQFIYSKRYHESFSFIQHDLRQGQKLCFEYFDPWFEYEYGKTFFKSIKLTGDK